VTFPLVVLWLHLLGVVAWIGGLMYQAHVLLPAARRGAAGAFADAARRALPVTWTAVALVVLTGFNNVTRLGPLERVMESGAGLLLAGKFLLVLAMVALAGQRDFAQVPRLARALAARPRVILLDEVLSGLNPAEITSAIGLIRAIQKRGVAILFVEHLMRAVLDISDRVVVLNEGEVIAAGSPRDVMRAPRVIDVYLGKAHVVA
jgi:uncharacterized membrane protein